MMGLAMLLALADPTYGAPGQTSASIPLCAADLNGNGDAADPGETARCLPTGSEGWSCPLEQVACSSGNDAEYSCPLGVQYGCTASSSDTVPKCSRIPCIDTNAHPIVTEALTDDPGVATTGDIDEDDHCLATIEIFSGRALRCRSPGLDDSFQNCCADHGRIFKDGMGSSITTISTKIGIVKGVFAGMKAAYSAYRAGATASEAANAGAHAIVVGIDPTSIAISLAINVMVEVLLQGCDQQDMEVGLLRGSEMCHEVGSYCATSVLGICLQRARSQCCFNTKLGRMIQEQGRPQLKAFNAIGWGPVKHPDCRGFTADEFQALDFSKMDLSGYYSEVETRAQIDVERDMKDKTDAYLQTVDQ